MRTLFVIILAGAAAVALPRRAVSQSQRPASDTALRVDQCPADDGAQTIRDRKNVASQLYDRGLVLYEEGDYEGAIDAFVESYCAKPHPASFYNIAQSYERILKFELSIVYFERYVAESDPEAATTQKARLRAEVLSVLPAQIRVATVPAGATITIRDATGLRARGKANQEQPLEVVRGDYTMHVSLPGYQDITRSITAKPGQPYSHYLRLVPQTGTLNVTATPNQARIFLDDRLVGDGSYKASLAVGRYEITIEAVGREPQKGVAIVKAGEASDVSFELKPPKKSGRNTLLIGSTVGLGTTGATAASYIFGQGTAVTAAGLLASTAVGFGSAYYGIPESTTQGDAWFMIGTSLIGALDGALLGSMFACDVNGEGEGQADGCTSEERSKAITAAALGGGLLGAVGSSITHKRFKMDTGDVAVLGSAALWGISSGALLYAVFDSDSRIRDPLLWSGLNLGLVAGTGILATSDLSLERIALIDLGGLGGVLGGALLAKAFRRGDEQLQHVSIAGMVAGLVGATFLTLDLDDKGVSGRSGPTTSGILTPNLTPFVGSTTDATGNLVPNLGFSLTL